MYRITRTLLPAICALFLLASCHTLPKHARFIPKDVLAVAGLNTGQMRKTLAWDAITGSSLLNDMQKNGDKTPAMIRDGENSGIDFSSTLYFYTKPDSRFDNEMRIGAVFPVANAGKIIAYIRKYVPSAVIHTVKDRSEALLDGKVYVGWNDEVLIAMNTIVRKTQHSEPAKPDTLGGSVYPGQPYSWTENIADTAATAAEMELAFNPGKDASIAGNGRFKALEGEGHDISIWVSYDAMSELMSNKGDMGMMGMSMVDAMWKSSAMATGIDFKKGSIDAHMRYYPSDSLLPVAREFGSQNVDAELLHHLPSGGLNAALGYHLSPVALKMILDKMGLSGAANLFLMQKGTNMDDILGAFSGDIVASVNNFRIESKMQQIDSATQQAYGMTPYPVTKPQMDFVLGMKVGDKAKMTKLLGFLTSSEILMQTGRDTYSLPNAADKFTLMVSDKYLAASSDPQVAEAFMKNGSGSMPDVVNKEVAGHVIGMWADIHSFMQAAGAMVSNSGSDSMAFNTVRNLFTTFTMNGGAFQSGANTYAMSLGFSNKEENSLVQLLHVAQQLSAANGKKKEVVMR